MKLNYAYLVLAAGLLLSSCGKAPSYTIIGTTTTNELEGEYVYLYEYGSRTPRDSALIEKGVFSFTGVQDTAIVASLGIADSVFKEVAKERRRMLYTGFSPYSAWFVLNNSIVRVLLDELPIVGGSPENKALNAYMQQLEDLYGNQPEIDSMMSSKVDSLVRLAETRIEELDEQAIAIHEDYIGRYPDRLSSAAILYNNRYTLPEACQRSLIAALDDTLKQWPSIVKLSNHLAALEKVAIGLKFTDFEMPAPDGKPHKLSEYAGVGKVVLIDFWASWCGPCRRSMPHLRELYAKYHAKGFEIVGVSFDRTEEAWKKGIADLQLPWPQISDVKFWQSAAAALYGVNSIPHTVLLDKDGIITAKNLHGQALDNKLAELLN